MPSPGDTANLQHNLNVLADLVILGSKLSYSPSAGRFSLDKPGPLQGTLRLLWRDSITKEEYFGKPIREVFVAARIAHQDTKAAQALNGLYNLRATYAGDKAKLDILDAVIQDASDAVHKEPLGVIKLRKDYQPYLIFSLSQVMFLPESNNGVCYSITVHWARRILLGKANFGVSSKHPTIRPPHTPVTLDSEQKKRINKKVDVILPMHAELNLYRSGKTNRGDDMMAVAKQAPYQKYGNFDIGGFGREHKIEIDTSGRELMDEVLADAKKCRRLYPNTNIFLINLGKKTGGHTIGIHLDGTLHFFDSNVGEFAFPQGSDHDETEFFNTWRQFYDDYEYWTLEGVSIKQ